MLSYPDDALRRTVMVAIFASIAVVLGVLESMIPLAVSIPGAKLGFGNIMILTCLYFFSAHDALALIVVKTILTAFILGTFSTFLFSFLGALFSFTIMLTLLRLGRESFSLTGISVVGGIAHNLGQLAGAAIVLGTIKIFYYLPFLLVAGVVTGILVGMASTRLVAALRRVDIFDGLERRAEGRGS